VNADMRILIADDHALLRQGIKLILTEEWERATFGEARDAAELLKLFRAENWDVVLLDLSMPGRGGLDVLLDLHHEKPQIPVLVLSAYPEDQYAIRVLKAGAAGFMNKESAPDELIKAIAKVRVGGKYVSDSLAEKFASQLGKSAHQLPHEALSNREYQVLCLIAAGKTPTQIAEELILSIKTISTFRARILDKMNMTSNAQLTRYAISHQLID
jgi:DNA-binding NarL/FixJ family response regulator